ncbi:hypothetical protein [Polyangium sp. y55x31]|uniref:hypothetical protein n=1 Tax=Polyangium sp. y55x31 TaxID=3042688 RepID=UPI00248214A4|nr:hypothetical protein [Polyangium sp. y55x31]MDI1482421.1 hypothetical protein [Polyangium sp. y55x31]
MTPRWVGLLLFVVLVLHAVIEKMPHGLLPEMLYACHVATAVLAVGVLLRKPALVLFGFSFHIGAGLWGYLFDLCETRTTTWTSVLVHVSPLIVGALEVRRSGLPRWAPWASFVFLASMVVLAYYATPPTLNVNLAHRPFPPVARYTPALWATWVTNLIFGFFLIHTTDFVVRKWLKQQWRTEQTKA